MRRNLLITLVILFGLVLVLGGASIARADNPPGKPPGQPNQSCQAQTSSPGNASSAPGSAFNTSGIAQTVYAGQQPQNSNNPNAVAQYDVACFQVSH
ncbi:MAG: adenylate cyclase [Aggregatilineales bacterium]